MSKLKFCTWNINGIRAVAKKDFFLWLEKSDLDLVSLQETKAQIEQLDQSFFERETHPYVNFNSAVRKGYSGVANYSKVKISKINHGINQKIFDSKLMPYLIEGIFTDKKNSILEFRQGPKFDINSSFNSSRSSLKGAEQIDLKILNKQIESFNSEGRIIESFIDIGSNKKILHYNVYFPNGGSGDERLLFKMQFYEVFWTYLFTMEKTYPYIIVTGDYNTAHKEEDLARPKENINISGFMPIERLYLDWFEEFGFIDAFRYLNPDSNDKYTWWSFRSGARPRNIGWRIDYFFVSKALKNNLLKSSIHDDIEGSDHCPVSLEISIP